MTQPNKPPQEDEVTRLNRIAKLANTQSVRLPTSGIKATAQWLDEQITALHRQLMHAAEDTARESGFHGDDIAKAVARRILGGRA